MISYWWTSATLGLSIGFAILMLIRRDYLHTRYATWWLLVAGAAILMGTFPRVVDVVGASLGVRYPPILLVLVCLGFILIKILTMDLERSQRELELRRLAQRIALMEQTQGIEIEKDEEHA